MWILSLCLILLLHLAILVNTQFTLWPEMVVYPYLINNGFLLYRDIINPYTPLFTYFLANFSIFFGYQPLPYQILTWGIILTVDSLIFLIIKSFTKGRFYAIAGSIFFVALSIPFGVNGLWYDLVQTPFILLTLHFFVRFTKNLQSKRTLITISVILTLTFFIKQQVVWFILWLGAFLAYSYRADFKKSIMEHKLAIFPPVIFLLAHTLFFWSQKTLGDFFYLSFYFPFFVASKMPGYILLPTTRQLIVLFSLILLFAPLIFKNSKEANLIFLTGVVLILFGFPRFDYFHLVPAVAVFAIAFVYNLMYLVKAPILVKTAFIFSLSLLLFISIRFVKNHAVTQIRFFEQDVLTTASLLKLITEPKEIIYIQNGPDQLLPLSNLMPTKPWAIQFPWYLEIEKIQTRVLMGLQREKPRLIVSKPFDQVHKYEIGSYRPEPLATFIDDNYKNTQQISDTLWLKAINEK